MNVLVLMGGDSPEREISLRSGKSFISALENSIHTVTSYDPADGDEGLGDAVRNADVVLPILHGINGEDGVIQDKLERLGAKFLGSNSKASKMAFDKKMTHVLLEENGFVLPQYEIVNSKSFSESEISKKPYVLKPIDNGSSVDMVIAREVTKQNTAESLRLLREYPEMLLEVLIEGVEITVPVLGNESLPIIVIIPPEGGEFDYENKYNGETEEICPVPESIVSKDLQKQAQKLATKVHLALGAKHLSRTDMIIQPDGQIVVLELNTIPGMTEQSLFPKAANVAGISMEDLVEKFIKMTKEGDQDG